MTRVIATNEIFGECARNLPEVEVCTPWDEDQEPARANILYADGDQTLRRVATQTLTRTGYRVTAAESGLRAWEALHASEYDLLITDTETPRLSGLELAAMARLEGMTLPIIVACGPLGFRTSPSMPSSASPPRSRSRSCRLICSGPWGKFSTRRPERFRPVTFS